MVDNPIQEEPLTADQNESFDALVADFRSQLVTYSRSIDPRGAEDAVHDAFVALRKRQERPPPVENPRAYLPDAPHR